MQGGEYGGAVDLLTLGSRPPQGRGAEERKNPGVSRHRGAASRGSRDTWGEGEHPGP